MGAQRRTTYRHFTWTFVDEDELDYAVTETLKNEKITEIVSVNFSTCALSGNVYHSCAVVVKMKEED